MPLPVERGKRLIQRVGIAGCAADEIAALAVLQIERGTALVGREQKAADVQKLGLRAVTPSILLRSSSGVSASSSR